jgi:hypothetical protein
LEKTGPEMFEASELERWFHPNQVNGYVKGIEIYEYLRDRNMLSDCLGYADLLAIQSKGVVFWRKHFSGEKVWGLKSIVRRRGSGMKGDINVGFNAPCLYENAGRELEVSWPWLEIHILESYETALRFPVVNFDI